MCVLAHVMFHPDLGVGLLDRLEVGVFIVLLFVGGLFAVLVDVSGIVLLVVEVFVAEAIDRFFVVVGVLLYLVAAFEIVLLNNILVINDPRLILLLPHQVHRVLSIPLPLHEFNMIILVTIVFLSPLHHTISKRRVLVSNSYLSVQSLLFFLQLFESVFHQ